MRNERQNVSPIGKVFNKSNKIPFVLINALHSTPFGVVSLTHIYSHTFTTGFTVGYSHLSPVGDIDFTYKINKKTIMPLLYKIRGLYERTKPRQWFNMNNPV